LDCREFINNLILTHVAVSSWLSTFDLQGA
jgi:hypothetical protein